MDWAGFGVSIWALRFRELEQAMRRMFHVSRAEPEEELQDVELPVGEQRAAVRREAARRMVTERR